MKTKRVRVDVKTQIALAAAISVAAMGASADSTSATGVTSVERVVHSIAMTTDYSPKIEVAGNKWGKLSTRSQGGDAKQWASQSNSSGYKWGTATSNGEPAMPTSDSKASWAGANGAVVQGYKWGVRSDTDQAGYKWGVRSDADQAGYKWGVR